jgi:hypothetical protein
MISGDSAKWFRHRTLHINPEKKRANHQVTKSTKSTKSTRSANQENLASGLCRFPETCLSPIRSSEMDPYNDRASDLSYSDTSGSFGVFGALGGSLVFFENPPLGVRAT